MMIVLDTTETFADLRMDGANYTFLRSFVSRNPVKLVVPQIVVEETVNHFRESLTAHLEEARNAIRSVTRLAPDAPVSISGDMSLEAECNKYREHLKNRLLLADQASYKDVEVASLVQRALSRRRPFDSGGKVGFRDAVLWETVLQVAKSQPNEIVLVTQNKKDFGEHGRLHDHLRADLVAKGLSNVPVTVCEGLNRFINEHVKPNLEKLDGVQKQIDEGEFPAFDAATFFAEWRMAIVDELRGHVEKIDLDRLTHRSAYTFRHPHLEDTADTLDTFQVADVWRVTEDQLGIGIDYHLSGQIGCVRESSIGPYDEPYDEEFVDAVEFVLLMTVVIDETSGEVVSWELNDMETKPTGDWGFPDWDD